MPFSGYLASTGRFNLFFVATAGAIGCNLGSTIAYAVGRYGGRPLVERWGPYILVSRRDLADADRFFARYGGAAVFVGRLLPVIRTFIAFPAGIARLPQLKFQIYTFVGSWPWCFALAYIGYKLGQQWDSDPRLHAILRRFDWLICRADCCGCGLVCLAAFPARQGLRSRPVRVCRICLATQYLQRRRRPLDATLAPKPRICPVSLAAAAGIPIAG